MSEQLFRDRRRRLAELTAELGLDGTLVYSWRRSQVGWFTGYWAGFLSNWCALWVGADGDAALGIRFGFDAPRAETTTDLPVVALMRPEDLVPAGTKRVGLVAADLAIDEAPASLSAALTAQRTEIADLSSEVIAWRALKPPEEVDSLRHATQVADAALRAAGELAPRGTNDFAIASMVEAEARRLGAFRALCLVGIGDGRIVTEPTDVRVGTHDAVGLELTLQVGPSWTHVNWTLLPAEPRPHQREAIDRCRDARRAIVAELLAGSPASAAVAAGDRALQACGLRDAREYDYGHGIGAHTPEIPRLVDGTTDQVMAGQVVAVHVSVRVPDGPTAFVGGPVVVDKDGAHELVASALWAE